MNLAALKKIVIKIGSSSLVDDDFRLREKWLESLVEDIAKMKREGGKVIIVTSGAVALGRFKITREYRKLNLQEKQAAAAIGQPLLMSEYNKKFAEHKITTAQMLLTISDIEHRKSYLNAKNTIEALLENDIVPIINENDSVATEELRVGDNDRLSAMVAQMVFADKLIIFSDIDGLYTDDPNKNKAAKFISVVEKIDEKIEALAKGSGSKTGTGGMATKIEAAKIAAAAGCETVITSGKKNNPITSLASRAAKYTLFESDVSPNNARKKWILNTLSIKGSIVVDAGAEKALKQGKSLLPVGVVEVSGSFLKGDKVAVLNESGREVAKGITQYNSKDAEKIKRKKGDEIEEILSHDFTKKYLVHADDMVLTK
ncbi:MAG TPA: glutamate 5-kinase [Alphaproteobacteria bacterium]|nr:glutamate 5-kinase [Alphaproteobacteria bacterium]